MRNQIDKEIRLDADILAGLATYDTGIDGLKLSRFDRVLGLNRERIERVYRGRGTADAAFESFGRPGCGGRVAASVLLE
jgi:hypothetical protein